MYRKFRRVHFVGIGGSGMSGIAEVLLNLGYAVSGSDLKRSPVTDRLAGMGARTYEGHAAGNIEAAQVVVTSTAVRPDNPEVTAARRAGVPVIPRAEMLAELMRLKYGVAIAGSHGKTTTTSMVALVLDRGGLDPTVVVGGRLGVLGSGARLGKGDFMVAEADESDRSFLKLTPTVAVVTNIDREHLDTYHDLADVQEAFVGFVNKVPFYGAVVLCLDDAPAREILPKVERRVITYGLSAQAEVQARNVVLGPAGSRFVVAARGEELGSVSLAVPGAHNVVNALAAVTVGLDLEIPLPAILAGLGAFTGVDRRFQVRGTAGGVTVVDDYGHHPAEIRATLETLARLAEGRRTVVLFQPHRFTRTQFLWDEFCRAFDRADVLLLTDIYPASEEARPGITSAALAAAITAGGHRAARYAGDLASASVALAAEAKEDDVVLTLGAGSVWTAGDDLLREGELTERDDGQLDLVFRPERTPLPVPREVELENEPPFLRPRQRARVQKPRRGALGRVVLGLNVVALSAVGAGLVWAGYSRLVVSDRLKVMKLEVRGQNFLSEAEVRETLGPAVGENLLTLDLEALEQHLHVSPWVESANVRRTLPDTLRVEIEERRPVALAEIDRLYLMDGNGTLIDIYGPRTATFDLPIVRGLGGLGLAERRERARRVAALLEDVGDLASLISEVQVDEGGELEAVLVGGDVVRLGEPPYRQKLEAFVALRAALRERCPEAELFDLRFRDRIYAKEKKGVAPPPAVPSGVSAPVGGSRADLGASDQGR